MMYLTHRVRSRLQRVGLWPRITRRCLVLSAVLCLAQSTSPSWAIAGTTTSKEIETYKLYTHIKLLDSKEFICVNALWTKESNWSKTSKNKKSSAYGIPQLLNLKETDPYKQIDKGIIYINSRYKTINGKVTNTPMCNAWAHFKAKGYY
jgi:hypothetical protein